MSSMALRRSVRAGAAVMPLVPAMPIISPVSPVPAVLAAITLATALLTLVPWVAVLRARRTILAVLRWSRRASIGTVARFTIRARRFWRALSLRL